MATPSFRSTDLQSWEFSTATAGMEMECGAAGMRHNDTWIEWEAKDLEERQGEMKIENEEAEKGGRCDEN